MKKLTSILFIASLFLIGFTSCEKQGEEPGNIPGMGNTPGELQIKEEFKAPEGVVMDTKLQGVEETTVESIFSQNKLKSTNSGWGFFGCGGSNWQGDFTLWVIVKLIAQNTNDDEMCFTIPTGTVFEVSDQEYQNGIVISPIEICIEPHSSCEVNLVLMCLNKGKTGSKSDVFYTLLGVTASQTMWNLLNLLQGKMCNIENYLYASPSAKLKAESEGDIEEYKDIADHIQNAIWQLTNDGKELTEDQIQYFQSLPDKE